MQNFPCDLKTQAKSLKRNHLPVTTVTEIPPDDERFAGFETRVEGNAI